MDKSKLNNLNNFFKFCSFVNGQTVVVLKNIFFNLSKVELMQIAYNEKHIIAVKVVVIIKVSQENICEERLTTDGLNLLSLTSLSSSCLINCKLSCNFLSFQHTFTIRRNIDTPQYFHTSKLIV